MKNPAKAFLLIFISIFISCEQMNSEKEGDNLICGVSNPINDLDWLNKEYKSMVGVPSINGIILFKFKDKYVIEIQGSTFNSTNQHQYYCDGKKLDLDNVSVFQDFKQNRTEIKILYGTKIWN